METKNKLTKEQEKEFMDLIEGTCWNPHCNNANCQEDRREVKQWIADEFARQRKV